jgi:hypothetical protein
LVFATHQTYRLIVSGGALALALALLAGCLWSWIRHGRRRSDRLYIPGLFLVTLAAVISLVSIAVRRHQAIAFTPEGLVAAIVWFTGFGLIIRAGRRRSRRAP